MSKKEASYLIVLGLVSYVPGVVTKDIILASVGSIFKPLLSTGKSEAYDEASLPVSRTSSSSSSQLVTPPVIYPVATSGLTSGTTIRLQIGINVLCLRS